MSELSAQASRNGEQHQQPENWLANSGILVPVIDFGPEGPYDNEPLPGMWRYIGIDARMQPKSRATSPSGASCRTTSPRGSEEQESQDGPGKHMYQCLLCNSKEEKKALLTTANANKSSRWGPTSRRQSNHLDVAKSDAAKQQREQTKKARGPHGLQPAENAREHGIGRNIGKLEFTNAVLNLVVKCNLPMSFVGSKGFVEFLDYVSPSLVQKLSCPETMTKLLIGKYAHEKMELIKRLSDVEFICVTVDLWSSYQKGYLRVTAHWLDDKLRRCGAHLALRRVFGRYTFDVISKFLHEIIIEFGIQDKLRSCVTDSGSNFVQCFKIFGPTIKPRQFPTACARSTSMSPHSAAGSRPSRCSHGCRGLLHVLPHDFMESDDNSVLGDLVEPMPTSNLPCFCLPTKIAEDAELTPEDEHEIQEAVQFGRVSRNPMFQLSESMRAKAVEDASSGEVLEPNTKVAKSSGQRGEAVAVQVAHGHHGWQHVEAVNFAFLEEADMEAVPLEEILLAQEEGGFDLKDEAILPPHFRCAHHTLNLLAGDVDGFLRNEKGIPGLATLATQTFHILTTVWARQGHSVLASEEIKSAFGHLFVIPGKTRWDSVFDACCMVVNLLKADLDGFNEVLDQNKLDRLSCEQMQFLQEFVLVMQPLATILDQLQKEGNGADPNEVVGIGCLIPFLMHIRDSVEHLIAGNDMLEDSSCDHDLSQSRSSCATVQPPKRGLWHCEPVAKYLLQRLEERFEAILNSEEHIAAALCHPVWKERWIPTYQRGTSRKIKLDRDSIKLILKKYIDIYSPLVMPAQRPWQSGKLSGISCSTRGAPDSQQFGLDITFDEEPSDEEEDMESKCEVRNLEIETEINLYLNRKKRRFWDVKSLEKYPNICRVYKALNTSLPASAGVEGLFSVYGSVQTPLCTAMLPSRFEAYAFLKANSSSKKKFDGKSKMTPSGL